MEDVREGDKLFIPKTQLPKSFPTIELGSKPNGYIKWWRKQFSWFPNDVQRAKEFSRLVGLYLAEGCSGRYKRKNRKNSYSNCVIWSFGAHEEGFADEVVEILSKNGLSSDKKLQSTPGTFGLSNCWIVRCRSIGLKRLFDEIGLGSNAGDKNCPILPSDLAKDVIGAWLDGDGSISGGTVSAYSKSTWLIHSVDKMLLGLGICASITDKGHTICISQRKDVEEVVKWTKRLKVKDDTYLTERHNKSPNLWDRENGWLATVRSTDLVQGPKAVVSIETESEKYVANGILTHNCFPKDVQALISLCQNDDIDVSLLEAVWFKNLMVRKEQDWYKIKGATTQNLHKDE